MKVYAVISKGGSMGYEFTDFCGIAFSEEECWIIIDGNKRGPRPGDRYEVWRRTPKTNERATVHRGERTLNFS
jgi:hypothetical protein